MTEPAAKNLLSAILLTTAHHISLLLPTLLLFLTASGLLSHFWGITPSVPPLFLYWTLALILLALIYMVYRKTYRKTYYASHAASEHTRLALADKLRKLPLSFFARKDLSDLTSTLMNDTAVVEQTLSGDIPNLFGGLLAFLLVIVALFFYNWQLALSLFICLPVAFGILAVSYRLTNAVNWKNRKAKLAVSDGVQEYLDAIKLMHASEKEETFRSGVEQKIRRVVRTSLLYEAVMGVFLSFAYNVLRVGMALVLITGAALLARHQLSVWTLFLFLFVAARIYDPLSDLFFKTGEFFYALVSASRIREIVQHPSQTGQKDVCLHTFTICFEHVSFGYEAGMDILHDINLTLRQGEITALVGPSGSGKSTLSKLCCRFWDVSGGMIRIDGRDIRMIDPEILLGYFSVVFQDVVLFNDTIYNNIKIGKENATEEEIHQAARLAQCEAFIEKLPDGYQATIGENGKTLSGGERQRISIARAFLKDAPIILLDEATASLDPENETHVQKAIGELIRNKTVVMIAHRLRSIEACNQIVVLRDGRVEETGTHADLMEQKGLYCRMVDLQRESAEWNLK